ncbi:MAG TPA: hypothetical protein VE912_10675 [Bacteroidales bacterium]|nr:hypothetical protein [Bacteroidales bacterium]
MKIVAGKTKNIFPNYSIKMVDHNYIYGLAFKCPFIVRVSECPFMKIDHFSIFEKVTWVGNLTYLEKKELLKIHEICRMNREGKSLL